MSFRWSHHTPVVLLPTPSVMSTAASLASRVSTHVRGSERFANSSQSRLSLTRSAFTRKIVVPHPCVAMSPFRNPFAKKPEPEGGKPLSGAEALALRIKKGKEKATKEGFQAVLADVRDSVNERNFGNGGSWPDAAAARRKGTCPLCGSHAPADLAKKAEENGEKVDAFTVDTIRQAKLGQHPLGWCVACAENNRLIDTSGGF